MFTLPSKLTVVAVKDFVSDEVHIVGKLSGNPRAILSFVAVDSTGKRVPDAPVAVVTMTGEAYNEFYAEWVSEDALYKVLLLMLSNKTTGIEVSGMDFQNIPGLKSNPADEVFADEQVAGQ